MNELEEIIKLLVLINKKMYENNKLLECIDVRFENLEKLMDKLLEGYI